MSFIDYSLCIESISRNTNFTWIYTLALSFLHYEYNIMQVLKCLINIIMSTPCGGGHIIFASGIRCPASGVTLGFRSFKEKV